MGVEWWSGGVVKLQYNRRNEPRGSPESVLARRNPAFRVHLRKKVVLLQNRRLQFRRVLCEDAVGLLK